MKLKQLSLAFAVPSLFVLALAACNESGASGGKGAHHIVQPLPDSTVIVKYNAGTITAKDVSDMMKTQFSRFEEEALESYKKSAERVLLMRLLSDEAKKQGLGSPEALVQKAVNDVNVTPAEVDQFFKANKLDKGVPDPKTGKVRKVSKDEVKGYLMDQARQQKQQAFLQGILASANASTVLEEPRTNVKLNGNEPFLGGANAKVVINEFSDFQCPFCAKGRAVVEQINKAYGDKVKIVFRHFPLDFHPQAMPAAIASVCAQKQGKFWEMHDKMFENQKDLNPEGIKKFAKDSGIDMAKFDTCLADGSISATIRADQAVAEEVGVNSTPTFFVNGKKINGAMPFEQFKSIIDSELAKM
ncbi:MAG: DsbA family protein [Bdellovibrionales bacterium]|nr:DsbA family protein [Bdellovibrionales bacterium]